MRWDPIAVHSLAEKSFGLKVTFFDVDEDQKSLKLVEGLSIGAKKFVEFVGEGEAKNRYFRILGAGGVAGRVFTPTLAGTFAISEDQSIIVVISFHEVSKQPEGGQGWEKVSENILYGMVWLKNGDEGYKLQNRFIELKGFESHSPKTVSFYQTPRGPRGAEVGFFVGKTLKTPVWYKIENQELRGDFSGPQINLQPEFDLLGQGIEPQSQNSGLSCSFSKFHFFEKKLKSGQSEGFEYIMRIIWRQTDVHDLMISDFWYDFSISGWRFKNSQKIKNLELYEDDINIIKQNRWIVGKRSLFAPTLGSKESKTNYKLIQRLDAKIAYIFESEAHPGYIYALEKGMFFKMTLVLFKIAEIGLVKQRSFFEFSREYCFLDTRMILSSCFRLAIHVDQLSDTIGHEKNAKKEDFFKLGQKRIYVNLRPLPAILASNAHHQGRKPSRIGSNLDRTPKNREIEIAMFTPDKREDRVKVNWKDLKEFTDYNCRLIMEIVEAEIKNLQNLSSLIEIADSSIFKRSKKLHTVERIQDKLNSLGTWAYDRVLEYVHSRYNLLFLAVVDKNPRLVRELLDTYGYHPYLYEPGFDPVEAAIEIGDFETLDVILGFLSGASESTTSESLHEMFQVQSDLLKKSLKEQTDQFRENKILGLLDHSKFIKALESGHKGLQELIIATAIEQDIYKLIKSSVTGKYSEIEENNPFRRISQYPLQPGQLVATFDTESTTINRPIHSKLKITLTEAVRSNTATESVKIKSLRVKINKSIFHQSCLNFIQAAINLPEEQLEGDLKHVIGHLWRANKWLWVLPFVFLEWATMLAFFAQIVWMNDSIILTLLVVILGCIQLAFEFLAALKDLPYYFSVVFNYMDLIQYMSIPVLSTMVYVSQSSDSDLLDRRNTRTNLYINLVILIAGFRGISGLKLLDSTRYLIAMILQVFFDMANLALITLLSVIIFSVVGINHLALDSLETEGWLQFRAQMNYYFNVMFGNWTDQADEFDSNRFLVYIGSGVFFAFIMANLVIGVISQTFDNFEQTKELVDTQQILAILLEYSSILSYFRRSGVGEADRAGMTNICLVLKASSEGNGGEGVVRMVQELVEGVGVLKEEVKKINEDRKKEKEEMKEYLEELKGLVSESMGRPM